MMWSCFALVAFLQTGPDLTLVNRLDVRGVDTDKAIALPSHLKELDGAESTIRLKGGVVRIDSSRAMGPLRPGSYYLIFNDGSIAGVIPAARTFFRLQASSEPTLEGPGMTTTPTGERAEILGYAVERIEYSIRIPLPIPEDVLETLPPEIPRELIVTIDAWVTQALNGQVDGLERAWSAIGALGGMVDIKDTPRGQGLALKQVLRMPFPEGVRLEMVAQSVQLGTLDAALFSIPAGYQEVPAPKLGEK